MTGIKLGLIGSWAGLAWMTMVSALPPAAGHAIETANQMKSLGFAGLLCLISLSLLGSTLYLARKRDMEQKEAREDMKKAHDEHTQRLYNTIEKNTKAAEQVRDVGVRTIVLIELVDETMKTVNADAKARVQSCHDMIASLRGKL